MSEKSHRSFEVIPGGKSGDPHAELKELYSKYGGSVFGRCLYLLRDRAKAEDAMQDVFAKAALEPKLAEIFAARQEKVMFVKGDKDLDFGKVAEVIDMGHQAEVDKYLTQSQREFQANTVPLEKANPVLWEKLQRARAKMSEPHF